MEHRIRFSFLLLTLVLLSSTARSDLVISRADRWVDLSSHIVRAISSLKVENEGPHDVSEILLAFPAAQAINLAGLRTIYSEGKKFSTVLQTEPTEVKGEHSDMSFYLAALPRKLVKGKIISLQVLAVFINALKPFPEEITQAESQLVTYTDNLYYTSPYPVMNQSLLYKLPGRVESYTRNHKVKLAESELRYGPFEEQPAFSYEPVVVHFENNNPFAVANELVREIEISHWGNVRVTEQYNLCHGGARLKNGFSRFEYQTRPHASGASSFRTLVAKLPPRAHSVYYRDEIGNISTSHLWGDSQKTQLEIELRFPLFGGWKTTFTIAYSLPLQDFLFKSNGAKRVLDINFGSPIGEILVKKHIVKVVLPEGSKDISVETPFPTKQSQDVKYSHLDIVGRPVVVLEKDNVIPEYNQYFQVYYKFNNISLLSKPMMLIIGIFLLFVACIVYMHTDVAFSKNSTTYIEELQREEVQDTVQNIRNIFHQCLAVHDKLESSLRDLFLNGDVQSCKTAHKVADAQFIELTKEMERLLSFLHSCSQASSIFPEIEELVAKEKEMQEKMAKQANIVKSFVKKISRERYREQITSQPQKHAALRREIKALLDSIAEI